MKKALVFMFALTSGILYAQEQSAFRLERYAGMLSAGLNPANTAFNPSSWEIDLVEADLFGYQNYGFLENASVPEVWRKRENIVVKPEISPERPAPPGALLLDFYGESKGQLAGVAQGRVSGPGFSVRFGEGRHTIGLTTAARFQASSYGAPSYLRYEPSKAIEYGQIVLTQPAKIAAMAWVEAGIHYNYRNMDGDILQAFGVTPRLLMGVQGGFAAVDESFEYVRVVEDSLRFNTGNWNFGYTTDAAYAADANAYSPGINGYGLGLDAGYSWAMPLEDADRPEDYWWRAGVSLIDFGWINFGKNAERHHVQFDTAIAIHSQPIEQAGSLEQTIRQASLDFLGDSLASVSGHSFSIGLPTALSAQFDYRIAPRIYASAFVVQRVPLFRNTLKRPNTLAVVPRFEHRWWMVSLPVVLNDYQTLKVGFAARLGVLYVGTDHLGSFIGQKQLTGSDFYVALKVNGFSFGKWGDRRGGLRKKDRHWKKVGCYEF